MSDMGETGWWAVIALLTRYKTRSRLLPTASLSLTPHRQAQAHRHLPPALAEQQKVRKRSMRRV